MTALYHRTVDILLEQIEKHFPVFNEEALKDFLPNNKTFVDSLCSDDDVNSRIFGYLPESCVGCHMTDTLELWPHLAANPILISVGHLRKIKIPVLCCTNCNIANYPDMISFGVFPIHNKVLISIDYILDVKDNLVSGREYYICLFSILLLIPGSSVIDRIINKMSLLSMMHGLSGMEVNVRNTAISIQECAIGNITVFWCTLSYYFLSRSNSEDDNA